MCVIAPLKLIRNILKRFRIPLSQNERSHQNAETYTTQHTVQMLWTCMKILIIAKVDFSVPCRLLSQNVSDLYTYASYYLLCF